MSFRAKEKHTLLPPLNLGEIEADGFFQERIKPFILEKLENLRTLDAARVERAKNELPEDYEMNYMFYDHAYRAAEDMKKTALLLGADDNTSEVLYWAMLAHDIGKAELPLEIWDTVKKPEGKDKALKRTHTDIGVNMVREELDFEHPFLDLMCDMIGKHHEQMDGNGQKGIRGEELSPYVRLACIIESFDGYSRAPYHDQNRDVSIPTVLNRMRVEKGAALYDMDLFEAFAEIKMKEYKESLDAQPQKQDAPSSWKPLQN